MAVRAGGLVLRGDFNHWEDDDYTKDGEIKLSERPTRASVLDNNAAIPPGVHVVSWNQDSAAQKRDDAIPETLTKRGLVMLGPAPKRIKTVRVFILMAFGREICSYVGRGSKTGEICQMMEKMVGTGGWWPSSGVDQLL